MLKFFSLKNLKLLLIFCLTLTSLPLNQINKIKAESRIKENYENNNFYILDSGDILEITITGPELNNQQICLIDVTGQCDLSRIGRIQADSYTIDEFSKILNEKYKKIYNFPTTKLKFIKYRDFKIYILGEINKPGLYNFPFKNPRDGISTPIPTVFDSIRAAGGLTDFSNLSNIEVIRENSRSNGGGKIKTSLNFVNLLKNGDFSQNITLRDKDIIKISKSETPLDNSLLLSNINSEYIKVYISGRIPDPGRKEIARNASLNEAIALTGGINTISGPIQFIRFNSDGTTDKRSIKYNSKSVKGTFKNPYLKQDDIIYVGKTSFNVAAEIINTITEPLQGLVSVYGLYKIFND